jgi:hypothetical protein
MLIHVTGFNERESSGKLMADVRIWPLRSSLNLLSHCSGRMLLLFEEFLRP